MKMDKNLYNLLKMLHHQYGIFIGKKSLDRLMTFVSGYIYCVKERENLQLDFLVNFQRFVETYYNIQNNIFLFRNWVEIITFFNTSEEEAFEAFFELLEVYLSADSQK